MHPVMDHIALNVEETESMITFYTEILGGTPERLEAYHGGEVAFPSVRLNPDTVIDLFPPKMWCQYGAIQRGITSMNHFCMAMDKEEWEALYERLQNSGIVIEEGPDPRWGAHGTGTSIYFRDPEGNLLEARYYA